MAKKLRELKPLNAEELNLEAILRNAEEARRKFFPGTEIKEEKRKRIFRKGATFVSR